MEPALGERDDLALASLPADPERAPQWSPLLESGMTADPADHHQHDHRAAMEPALSLPFNLG